jgi:hypothetical protein
LATWNAKKLGEATCKLCQDTIEDLHQFVVKCPDKRKVWHHVMIQYDTSFATFTPTDIWKTLNFIDKHKWTFLFVNMWGRLSCLYGDITGPFRLEKNLNHGEAMGMYEAELKYQQ